MPKQVENLRLDGDVERRAGLVRDEDSGAGDQCAGDHGALAHAAGKFERTLVDAAVRVGDADIFQHLPHRRTGAVERLAQCLGDLRADGGERIEGCLRLLEDHRHAPASDRLHGALRNGGDVVVAQPNGAAGAADCRR